MVNTKPMATGHRREHKLYLLAIFLVVALAACASEPATVIKEAVAGDMASPSYNNDGAQGFYDDDETSYHEESDIQIQERLIIRNADLSIVVEDTEQSMDSIETLVKDSEGWVVNSSVWEYNGVKRGNLNVRIPVMALDGFIDAVEALANEVTSKNVSGQDVTEEYIDLQARLINLEATRDRVRNFLDESRNVEEALQVNTELSHLEGEIEQLTGRKKYLEESAQFSAVSIEVTPDELHQPIQVGRWEPQGTARNAIKALISALQWLVDLVIFLALLILPLALVIGAPIYLLIKVMRRRRAKRKTISE